MGRVSLFGAFGTRSDGPAHLRKARFPSPIPRMPAHPHFRNQLLRSLAEYGSSGVYPVTGASPAKHALELSREPGTSRKDFPGRESDLRLMVWHIEPVTPDLLRPSERLAKRGLNEHRIRGVDGHQ